MKMGGLSPLVAPCVTLWPPSRDTGERLDLAFCPAVPAQLSPAAVATTPEDPRRRLAQNARATGAHVYLQAAKSSRLIVWA